VYSSKKKKIKANVYNRDLMCLMRNKYDKICLKRAPCTNYANMNKN
jgi:hypothetical protein